MRMGGLGVLAVVALMAAPAAAQDPPSPAIYTQSVTEEFRVPTEHGSIYGWVTRPVVPPGERVPVVLTYSPYSATSTPTPGAPGDYYVQRGFARARVHLVGTNRSGGCTDYGGLRERRTAHDVVEFLGTRPWSNGRVGMIGGSYDGTTQWAAAVEDPPHLAAIVPQVAITRWWDYAFGQGVRFFSGFGTPLLFDVGYDQARVPSATSMDPAELDAIADEADPCDDVEHQLRGYGPDPVHDAFWDERDYRALAARIDVPVLVEGSWLDYNVHAINTAEMWAALPADVFKLLRVGRQGHGGSDLADAAATRLAFLDRFLKDRDSGIESVPRVISRDNAVAAKGLAYADWPPPGTVTEALSLAGTTGTQTVLGGPDATWSDTDPLLHESDAMRAPGETAVVFLSAPLSRSRTVAGTPELDVWLRTNAESTHVTPVLFEETAAGARTVISRGLLNSRNRDSIRTSTTLPAGGEWRAKVRFQPAHHRLGAGSRIGLALMSHNRADALYGDTTRATSTVLLERAPRLLVPFAP